MANRAKAILVQDLIVGDKITITPPKVKVINITSLSKIYNTDVQGKVIEVESIDPKMKGYKTTILLSPETKVKMMPRPTWWQRTKMRWAEAKKAKAAQAKKQANTSFIGKIK